MEWGLGWRKMRISRAGSGAGEIHCLKKCGKAKCRFRVGYPGMPAIIADQPGQPGKTRHGGIFNALAVSHGPAIPQ